MSSAAEERLFLTGPKGNIEAIWQPSSGKEQKSAIICHPHPLHGGSMGNKVVTTLARAWRDMGYGVLRFNFRGVGKSEGEHDGGRGEIDDLLAALAWLKGTHGVENWDLAGFSFGSWVAAAAVARLPVEQRPQHLVLVAPPVYYDGFTDLHPVVPTWVLLGEEDEVVEPAAVKQWVASRHPAPELLCFPAAGHFFHGQLTLMKEAVTNQLTRLA